MSEMTVVEEMNAMIAGNYTSEVMNDDSTPNEIDNEIVDVPVVEEEGVVTNPEDTIAAEEAVGTVAPEDGEVALDPENAEPTTPEQTEDTQVDGVGKKPEEAKEDEPAAEDGSTNYKQQYEELLSQSESAFAFQKKVTGDFKANGKNVSGITDPDKIVKGLQKATGLTKKLEGYKSIKPLMKPLEDRGLLQDTAKFDMLMKLADGDKNAMRHYLKENNIDPLDLDSDDEIDYDSSSTVTSREEIMFSEMTDMADGYGVTEQFKSTVLRDWDEGSAQKLFDEKDGSVIANQLAAQMESGVFDKVNALAENLKMTDPRFSDMNSFDQYNAASSVLREKTEADNLTKYKESKVVAERAAAKVATETSRLAKIESEKAKLLKTQTDADYTAKVNAKNAEIAKQRESAANASTPRTSTAPSTGLDPMAMSTTDFRKQWKSLLAK